MSLEPAVTAGSDPESPAWRRPRPPVDRSDVLIGVGLFAMSLLSLAFGTVASGPEAPSVWVSVPVVAALTLPMVVRRRYPIAVGLLVTCTGVLCGELGVPEMVVSQIALFMAVYVIGAWTRNRRAALWVRVVILVGMAGWLVVALLRLAADHRADPAAGSTTVLYAQIGILVLINILYFAGAYWFGEHSWRAAAQRAVVAARTAELQADRHRLARQAVTIERMRVARELHDAVAHHVSLMGVQAAAARAVLTTDPPRAAETLEHLEQSARSAVAELYGLLGALREDDVDDEQDGPPGVAADRPGPLTHPPVGVDQLPELVEQARSAGVSAGLDQVGTPRPLPPELSLTLYRVTQEALTNVVKHSGPGTEVHVCLRWLPDGIELEVADDGRGRRAVAGSAGMGQRNMRERVTALCGRWESGPRVDAGYLVRATFGAAG